MSFPPDILRGRRAIAGPIAGLLMSVVAAAPPGQAQDDGAQGDGAQRSVLGYARWADQVLASPPDGIAFLPALEERFAERVSAKRREHDLGTLQRDPALRRAARAHAVDMLQQGYTGHVGPAGRSATERVGILDRRFIGASGENLAENAGIPAGAVAQQVGPMALKLISGFMESAEHRKNLLEPSYTHQGIGAAALDDRLIVVHVFGDRRAALAQDLPLQVQEGADLPLAFREAEDLSTPARYAFARLGQQTGEVVPLDVSLTEVAVDPGAYQLQFFLPTDQSDRFLVAPGPIVVVR